MRGGGEVVEHNVWWGKGNHGTECFRVLFFVFKLLRIESGLLTMLIESVLVIFIGIKLLFLLFFFIYVF